MRKILRLNDNTEIKAARLKEFDVIEIGETVYTKQGSDEVISEKEAFGKLFEAVEAMADIAASLRKSNELTETMMTNAAKGAYPIE